MTVSWPESVRFLRHDSIDSTNEEARRLAASGETGPVWIVAREQTAGRGRRGREWVSQAGNLFATLLMRAPQTLSAQLAFAAGLAAGETVAHFAPAVPVNLKWPNDVLLDGRKAAGILLEGIGSEALAIGFGINLAHHPDATEFPATSIASVSGAAPQVEEVLALLAGAMTAWYEVLRGQGFAPLREAWLARAAMLGEDIRVRLHEGEITGMFEGIDEGGALLLRLADGTSARITAGDVFF